jgi:hypothetical protein
MNTDFNFRLAQFRGIWRKIEGIRNNRRYMQHSWIQGDFEVKV